MSERTNTGCIIAGAIGCLVASVLGLIALGAFFAFFYVSRSAPPTATPAPLPAPTFTPPTETPPTETSSEDFTVKIEHTPYVVVGSSTAELRKQMDRLGPVDAHGRHDAYTRWFVRWVHPYERGADGCSLGDVKVTVEVKYTLPRWQPPEGTPSDVITRWNRYLKALETHEHGHGDHGVRAGKDVLASLRKLERRQSCEALGAAANTKGHEIVDEYRKKDRNYDRTTNHGATQGARFP